jgi:hypothetical protein
MGKPGVLATVALATILAFAGCGGSDGGSTSAAPPTTRQPAELAREVHLLVTDAEAAKTFGDRQRRLLWDALDAGCYPCAATHRAALHRATRRVRRLNARMADLTIELRQAAAGIRAQAATP